MVAGGQRRVGGHGGSGAGGNGKWEASRAGGGDVAAAIDGVNCVEATVRSLGRCE
jgi:hypothetical protein